MLDICTCIISFIVFSDLVPDLYFQDTDTWDSCDMHYLDYMTFLEYYVILFCDLEFLWSCDYVTQQLLVQDISCSLYTCHTMHAWSPCIWSIVSFIPIIVITFSSWYSKTYCAYVLLIVTTFSYSLFYRSFPFVYSC